MQINTRIFTKSSKGLFCLLSKNWFSAAEAAQTAQKSPIAQELSKGIENNSSRRVREILKAASQKPLTNFQDANIPFNLQGTKDFNVVRRESDENVINADNVDLGKVEEQFKEIIVKYLKGLESGKVEDFPDMESNFLLRVLESINILKNNGFSIELVKNDEGFKQKNLSEKVKIFERMHVVGVSVERARNAARDHYYFEGDLEEKGIVFYIAEDSYLNDPARTFKFPWEVEKNPVVRKNWKQMVARLYVQYTSPYILRIKDRRNNYTQEQNYSFNHVAVLENQLTNPPVGVFVRHSIEEWTKSFKLGKRWVLTDFDGSLNGNPFLVNASEHPKLVYTQNRFKDI